MINGNRLSKGQAMTVRVALNAFAVDLQDGLGDDEHAQKMTAAYKARLNELFRMIDLRTRVRSER